MQETWFRKIPWRRAWQPTPVFLPGESHRQRSLAGYCAQGRKGLDMTEHAHSCPVRSSDPQLQHQGPMLCLDVFKDPESGQLVSKLVSDIFITEVIGLLPGF